MRGDLLDLVLVVLCLGGVVVGLREGFLYGVLSTVGLVGGGYLGTRLAPTIARHWTGPSSSTVAVVSFFVFAVLGLVVLSALGVRLRGALTWRPARAVDSTAGAALWVVAILLVAWFLGSSVSQYGVGGIASQVRRSAVLKAVDGVIPGAVRADAASFRRLLNSTGFPALTDPLAQERVRDTPAPDPAVLGSTAVRAARASIVKIRGNAPTCGVGREGSGFLVTADRVVTNAHVLAGVRDPVVSLPGVGTVDATVVLYDPDVDIAVLAIPSQDATPLRFAGDASAGASAVVAGYPEDGPFTAVAARVRDQQTIQGPNIYQTRTVSRSVYAVRSTIVPGNSGGPLLASDGEVYGVVFAASTTDSQTGYALTADEVAADVRAGEAASGPVSTQGCD